MYFASFFSDWPLARMRDRNWKLKCQQLILNSSTNKSLNRAKPFWRRFLWLSRVDPLGSRDIFELWAFWLGKITFTCSAGCDEAKRSQAAITHAWRLSPLCSLGKKLVLYFVGLEPFFIIVVVLLSLSLCPNAQHSHCSLTLSPSFSLFIVLCLFCVWH